jgi:hypothetical protein
MKESRPDTRGHSLVLSWERLAILGLLIALVFTVTGYEIASAAVNNSDGTYNACYKTKSGNLRLQVTACKRAEHEVTLSGFVPIYANVSSTGVLGSNQHAVSVTLHSPSYIVTFDRDVSSCGISAITSGSSSSNVVAAHGPTLGGKPTDVWVTPAFGTTGASDSFSIVVMC